MSSRRLFAVTRKRGVGWNPAQPMEEQQEWKTHAAFMDALESQGFVLLGGPLEGTPDVLLIIRAKDEEEINTQLAADCWTQNGLLLTTRIVPWTLRLGRLD